MEIKQWFQRLGSASNGNDASVCDVPRPSTFTLKGFNSWTPLPAALDCRGVGRVLCRARR
jgi:hypothetical protein